MTVELLFDQLRARTTEPQSLADPIEVNALATPALVLNRANFEANLTKMADHVDAFDFSNAFVHMAKRMQSNEKIQDPGLFWFVFVRIISRGSPRKFAWALHIQILWSPVAKFFKLPIARANLSTNL